MTGAGFDTSLFGEYSQFWIWAVLLFFIVVLSRKWLAEAFGLPFNTPFAFIGAYVPFVIVATFIMIPIKWAFLAGFVGFIIGGFLLGSFTGDGG